MTSAPQPIALGPNQPDRPYRGGAGIARFRGVPQPSEYAPEDFVASTTEIFSGGGIGLSRLPSGELLRDAVAADPAAWLGADHVDAFGAETELLVKLLDTGERLFVHFHPDREFARTALGLAHGKTEAWIIIAAEEGASARLGFTRDISAEEAAEWVRGQRVDDMLAAMHEVPLAVGDTLFVPGGMPHAIGAGITLVELQEPTDLSILLEYDGYKGLGRDSAFLGLDQDAALGALDRTASSPEQLAAVRASRPAESGIQPLFPAAADAFFRAERITGDVELEPGFAVLVVLDGDGELAWSGGSAAVRAGDTLVVPHAVGALRLTGVTALRCRPPAA